MPASGPRRRGPRAPRRPAGAGIGARSARNASGIVPRREARRAPRARAARRLRDHARRPRWLPASGPTTRITQPSPSSSCRQARRRERPTPFGFLAAAQPQIGRMRDREQALDHGRTSASKAGTKACMLRQAQQGAIVLQRVMRGPHHAVAVAAAVADQHDRQVVQADVVADLLEGPGVDERGDAVDPRSQPAHASPAATETMFCSATPALMNRGAHRVAQAAPGP